MQERHKNKNQYFKEQGITTEEYVIPFLKDVMQIDEDTSILEIGCGEGGNLKPFLDLGCKTVVGVDLSPNKIEKAREIFANHLQFRNINFFMEDIYESKSLGQYDIIIMRDVIEHIHNQERFMEYVKKFLKPGGKFFLGFPPWYMPFGGHQQTCNSKLLSVLPFYHILPTFIYRLILKFFGETPGKIDSLLEIKETGISIERFERILKASGYQKDRRVFYFINPNYEVKFKLKPKKLPPIMNIPLIRNFYTTAMYYIISLPHKQST